MSFSQNLNEYATFSFQWREWKYLMHLWRKHLQLNLKLVRSVLLSQGIGFISPVMDDIFVTLSSENIKNNSDNWFDVKREHCSKMNGGKKR